MGNLQAPSDCVGSECADFPIEDESIISLDGDLAAYIDITPFPGLTQLSVWESPGEHNFAAWRAKEEQLMQLMMAVRDDDAPRVLQLFTEGVDMDDMRKALALAARHGSLNVVRELVSIGCSVKFVDSRYNATPLHLAACGGHPDICDIILDALADVNVEFNGLTALSYARRLGNIEVQEVIEKQIALAPHLSTAPVEQVNRRHIVLPRVSAILTEAVLLWDFSNEKRVVATNSVDDVRSEFSYASDTELISNVSTYIVNDLAQSPQTSAASHGTTPEGGDSDSPQTSCSDSMQQGGATESSSTQNGYVADHKI